MTRRHGLIAFALVVGVVAAILVATGQPPRNCTWEQINLGKGAFIRQCVAHHAHAR
jgi:hypothetical protein